MPDEPFEIGKAYVLTEGKIDAAALATNTAQAVEETAEAVEMLNEIGYKVGGSE